MNFLDNLNFLDWIILIFVFLGALKGYRRGLIAGIMGFLGFILSAVLAGYFTPRVLAWAENRDIFVDWIAGFFAGYFNPTAPAWADFPQTDVPLSGMDLDGIFNYLQAVLSGSPEASKFIMETFYGQLVSAAVHIVVVAVLLVASVLLVHFIIRLLYAGMRGTFLGSLNRFWGFILGGAVNALFIGLFLFILTPFLVAGATAGEGYLYNLYGLFLDSFFVPYYLKLFSALSTWPMH
ncbi:MAG: CvpA family protein [Clostridia bacterium]|nr:CvpA family protein [Clostridia bacterium]